MSSRYITSNVEPEQLTYTLNAITLTDSARIVGSARYAEHLYPSDVDVFEIAISKGCAEYAKEEFSKGLSNIGKILSVEPSIQFVEFKAGKNQDFDWEAFLKTENKEDYVCRLHTQGILTKEETLLALSHIRAQEAEKLGLLFEEFSKVRWTLEELIAGRKMIRGNKELTLKKAISMNSVVKLDTVTWFSSRPQSVEVFYHLGYTEAGKVFNFYDMENYVRSLVKDINYYKDKNSLKTMKRLWSLSRVINCQNVMQSLIPVFGSDAAALNQIKADIETLLKIRSPIRKMLVTALEFNKRLRNHLTLEEYDPILDAKCDRIFKLWEEYSRTWEFDFESYDEYLKSLEAYLTPLIDEKSRHFYEVLKGNVRFCAVEGLTL